MTYVLHLGNSVGKLRHTRSVAYSVELVLLNKHQISDGVAYLRCYPYLLCGLSVIFYLKRVECVHVPDANHHRARHADDMLIFLVDRDVDNAEPVTDKSGGRLVDHTRIPQSNDLVGASRHDQIRPRTVVECTDAFRYRRALYWPVRT